MKTTKITIILFSLVLSASASAGPRNDNPACLAGEEALFQCNVRAGSAVLCATKKQKDDQGTTTYRFLANGQTRMIFPTAAESTTQSFRSSYASYSGGGETQVSFSRGAFTYALYDSMTRTSFVGSNDSALEAGILVVRNGRSVSRQVCQNDATIAWKIHDLFPKTDFLTCGEGVNSRIGGCSSRLRP